MPIQSKAVGLPLSRVEGPLKVTGGARYAAESYEPGMLFGVVVPATIAAGHIASIDVSAAERFAGVVKIFTHENRPSTAYRDSKWKDQVALPGHPFRPLEGERILFDGQPVALVVAESFEAARDAATLVRVHYLPEEPHTDLMRQLHTSYVPPVPRAKEMMPPPPRGNTQAAFDAAAIRISADYRMDGEHHNPMELFATTVLLGDDGTLTIHDKTQGSQNSQDYVCNVFGLATETVVVRNAYVGGAFGQALRPKYQLFFAVMASLDLKRSMKVEMSRREMFYLTWRPSSFQTVSLAADREGHLQAIRHHAVHATSRYEDYQENVANWSGLAYRCDNVELSYEIVKLDVATPGDMRAPGAATGITALEAAMDELAYEAGIDPLELRLRNFVHRDQNQDKDLTSKALHACYREGAARFGWAGRSQEPGSMQDGDDLVGWGMATGIWEASMSPAEATVQYCANGTVVVSAAASDIGTGTYTILGQIAAECFDRQIGDVTVRLGDSTLPKTGVEGGSWTAASSGSAVQAAAKAVIATLLKHAGKLHNSPLARASADEVEVAEGRLVLEANHQVGVAISEIMATAGLSSIEESAEVGPDKALARKFAAYTHSAIFVEVKVDSELGVIRVTRVVSAVAAGRILNPKTARSQILGGIVMGLGMALHEEGMIDHRTGRIVNHNLAEYHIPAHADVDNLEVIFVEEDDDKASPIGVKGLGEIGIVGVAAAISNAIFHATGKRVRSFPITMDKILESETRQ
ncbi:xanthine dehydrogenase family protein molybdopterin-binding subunit [Ensifer sp.]|uniref:xanthine dehydrogenase family protein molybdopterin-binding subunit n=1 Tax=Ensifer sp. TaxID=1872086 RepID=UPI00289803F5|nr:xanthine dehydrogenase family protein molybdopterin-binding subunit [Ensifer sp.]